MAEQIDTKLNRYDYLSMRYKTFSTYDVIGHMVWQLSFKDLLKNGLTDPGELYPHVPQTWGYQGIHK